MTEESEDEQEAPFDSYSELARKRAHLDNKLKATFESIFEKYGRDFDGIGDEIDIATGEIVVDNGHVLRMQDERDAGDRNKLRKHQSKNEPSDSSSKFLVEEDKSCYESSFNLIKEFQSPNEDNTFSEDDREDDLILRGLAQVNQSVQLPSKETFQHSQESSYGFATSSSTLRITTPSQANIHTKSTSQLRPSNVNFFAKCYSEQNSYSDSCWQVPNLPRFSNLITDLPSKAQPTLQNPYTPPTSVASRPTEKSSPNSLSQSTCQLKSSNMNFFFFATDLPRFSNFITDLSPAILSEFQNSPTSPTRAANFSAEKSPLKALSKSNSSSNNSKLPLKLEELDELSLGENEIKLISSETKRTPSIMPKGNKIYGNALSSPRLPSSIKRNKIYGNALNSPRVSSRIKKNKRDLRLMNIDDDIDELCVDHMESFSKKRLPSQLATPLATPSDRTTTSDIYSVLDDDNSILMMTQYSKKKKTIRTYGSRPPLKLKNICDSLCR